MGKTHDFPFTIEQVIALLPLKYRRPSATGIYVDCPFCHDKRVKMHIDYAKDAWRCNYCGEAGGMLQLYGRMKNLTNSEACWEICDAIQSGDYYSDCFDDKDMQVHVPKIEPAESLPIADAQVLNDTFQALLDVLELSLKHREHLRTKRGLTDEQIVTLGYKSTPPFHQCQRLAKRLIERGCTLEGVPGFYQKDGKWTIKFSSRTTGILIPVRGIDGLIKGCQIRLDIPIKDKEDPPEKAGTKYIWLSSVGKPMGTSSGSPAHFVGNPNARVVYVTEGFLKSDIAHYQMNRSFAATAGANNTAQLDKMFEVLAKNGTQLIVEAEDMDKYRNVAVNAGALKVYQLAKKHGMECKGLNWNPNYKGIDDWQLALKRNVVVEEESVKNDLLGARQGFRIYQLETSLLKIIPFAFAGIKELQKAEYKYPPASEYRLIHEGLMPCDENEDDKERLFRIAKHFGDILPKEYCGRSVAPSDVLELFDEDGRRYFYYDIDRFYPVQFSPMLAKK